MTDYTTTGDGLIAGIQYLAAMVETGRPASALARQFETVPQMLKNVRFRKGQEPLRAQAVLDVIRRAETRLEGCGRLLIRKSGTEPLIRVMAECEDEALLAEVVDGIVSAVERAV
jgi:phosphoglucosamine mutase